MKRKLALAAFLAATVAIFVGAHFALEDPATRWDFQQFYIAAQMERHGDGNQLYNFAAQAAYQQKYVDRSRHVLEPDYPFLYPGAVALLFLPLAWLPLPIAYILWTVMNVALLFLSVRIIQKEVGLGGGEWPLFVALLFAPVAVCLLHGQLSLLMLFLYSSSLAELRRGNTILAGLFVGLGTLKFQLVLGFLAIMMMRRAWRFLVGFPIAVARAER